jgi:hypothetical protein
MLSVLLVVLGPLLLVYLLVAIDDSARSWRSDS